MDIRSLIWLIIVVCIALVTSTCGKAVLETTPISIESPWVRSVSTTSAPGHSHEGQPAGEMADTQTTSMNSAAYMLIHNHSRQADTLLGVECDVAEAGELHLSQTENDITTMRMVTQIEVPAQGNIELKPGGFHIMLVNLKQNLNPGDTIILRLQFEKSGEVLVEADVRAPE